MNDTKTNFQVEFYKAKSGSHLKNIHRSHKTAQKVKFFIKNFFSKCDQIRRKLRILSHLLKKFLMENFVFCAA